MTTALSTTVAAWLDANGAPLTDIAVIQPADPFLDTAGEALRARIFLTENETGETLCLRPEFTIPVCLAHIAADGGAARRYGYLGTVFRQRRDGASEFPQAGIEDLGDTDRAGADARSLADALALVTHAAPGVEWRVSLGDQAVFEAVIKALGLPRGWRKKLARAFGNPVQLSALIATLGTPRTPHAGLPNDIAEALEAGAADPLAALIGARMEAQAYTRSASRTPAEIAERMIEQAALDDARLSDGHIAELRDFLAIETPLAEAGAALRAFAERLGGGLDGVLDAFDARVAALEARGVDMSAIAYLGAFGRPLDYYTGLVYEIAPAGSAKPVIGGGRYDRLLTLLGAPGEVPGIGFSVWLDRLAAEAGEGAR